MRYISTRGRAPALAFDDVLLAGLAEDGGLYVPETWPHFSPDEISSMAGLPYAQLAVRVITPFLGGRIEPAAVAAMAEDAYRGFNHIATAPLIQLERNLWLMELFHGPTLAFKDYALQLVGRLFDHILTKRGQRVTIVGATSGDTGSAAIEACRGRERIEIFILHPHGRVSEVQRRLMTSVAEPNVHNVAIEGSFDDCQDLVKAMFADRTLREHLKLSAVNSINWARVMAQIVYYFAAAVSLGAPRRPVGFAVPTGNFGNVYSGYGARAMGLPIAQLAVGSNRNDILTRFFETGVQEIRTVEPSLSPSMDIQVSSNFERLLFDLLGRDGVQVTDAMTRFRAEGRMGVGEAAWREVRKLFDGHRLDDPSTIETMRAVHRETGLVIDPHGAVGVAAARALRRDPAVPMVALATAHPAKFPDAVEQAVGVRPTLPPNLADLFAREERVTLLPNDLEAVKNFVRGRASLKGGGMTVNITRLPNGLLVATDRMESVETVSLGVWVGAGTRNERPEVNGIAHMLEHMAFKGTQRRSAQAIAEEIEAVGGHINAYTSREQTAYYAKVLAGDTPLAVDILGDILQNSTFEPAELERERTVVLQEIGQAKDTPDDIIFDHFQAAAFPDQPMGRAVLGTADIIRHLKRPALFDYMGAEYGAGRMILAAAGRLDHDAIVELAQRAFGTLRGNGATRPEPALYTGGDMREARDLEQLHIVLGFKGIALDDPDFYPSSALSTLLGGGMSSRLFQEVREKRGLAYSIYAFGASYSDTGAFGVYAGTSENDARELVSVIAGEMRAVAGKVTAAELARARAQLKASTLMALESTGARCERLAQNLMVYGRIVPVEEIVAKIDAIDEASVERVAARLLTSAPTVAAVGPLGQLGDYETIASRFQ